MHSYLQQYSIEFGPGIVCSVEYDYHCPFCYEKLREVFNWTSRVLPESTILLVNTYFYARRWVNKAVYTSLRKRALERDQNTASYGGGAQRKWLQWPPGTQMNTMNGVPTRVSRLRDGGVAARSPRSIRNRPAHGRKRESATLACPPYDNYRTRTIWADRTIYIQDDNGPNRKLNPAAFSANERVYSETALCYRIRMLIWIRGLFIRINYI